MGELIRGNFGGDMNEETSSSSENLMVDRGTETPYLNHLKFGELSGLLRDLIHISDEARETSLFKVGQNEIKRMSDEELIDMVNGYTEEGVKMKPTLYSILVEEIIERKL